MPARITQNQVTMAECVPEDLTFLDVYRENAWAQIIWNDPILEDVPEGEPTRGLRAQKAYMLRGLIEEMDEITGPDRVEPDYNRFGAIMLVEGNALMRPGVESPEAVTRHIKEFGDVSWYLANFLTLHYLDFQKVMPVGLLAWELDNVSQPRCTLESALEFEAMFPWKNLFSYSGKLIDAAKAVVPKPHDERILQERDLIIASGKFVLSMMHLAVARFDTTYEAILNGNRAKIDKRIQEGTVFDKSGGDDR